MSTELHPSTESDRRRDHRHLACFPTYVASEEDPRCPGLIRDMSASGALVLTRKPLPVGAPVKLEMFIEPSFKRETPRYATGHVVRVERRRPECADVWHHDVAVAFDPPV